jgi:hypothetical protein
MWPMHPTIRSPEKPVDAWKNLSSLETCPRFHRRVARRNRWRRRPPSPANVVGHGGRAAAMRKRLHPQKLQQRNCPASHGRCTGPTFGRAANLDCAPWANPAAIGSAVPGEGKLRQALVAHCAIRAPQPTYAVPFILLLWPAQGKDGESQATSNRTFISSNRRLATPSRLAVAVVIPRISSHKARRAVASRPRVGQAEPPVREHTRAMNLEITATMAVISRHWQFQEAPFGRRR